MRLIKQPLHRNLIIHILQIILVFDRRVKVVKRVVKIAFWGCSKTPKSA